MRYTPTDVCTAPYRCSLHYTDVGTEEQTLTWRNDELRFRVSCISQFSVPENKKHTLNVHTHSPVTRFAVPGWKAADQNKSNTACPVYEQFNLSV